MTGPKLDRDPYRDLLTPAQLANRLGVTTGRLANLRHHGEGIGYVKIGSRVAYRFTDVEAYENEHYVSGADLSTGRPARIANHLGVP